MQLTTMTTEKHREIQFSMYSKVLHSIKSASVFGAKSCKSS